MSAVALPVWNPADSDDWLTIDASPLRAAWMVLMSRQRAPGAAPSVTVEAVQVKGSDARRVRVVLNGVTFIMTGKEALHQSQLLVVELTPRADFIPIQPLASLLLSAGAMASTGPSS